MKKLFTLILSAFAVMGMQAQNEFPLQFADAEGNVIADGTVLMLTQVEDDGFNMLIPSGLYMKNVSSASVHGSGKYTISRLDNGVFQTCFPMNCVTQTSTGTYQTGEDDFDAGELKYMNTEWIPETTGSVVVDYTLVKYKQNAVTKKWNVDSDGPTVTLNFKYDPAAIAAVDDARQLQSVTYYTLDGRRTATPAAGIFVVKQKFVNGKTILSKQLFH